MVSVVIPTRARPALLAVTLRSVVRQEHVDMEVLVVDDGEHPSSQTVIDAIHDARIRRLCNTGPRGVSGARNTGIAAARGEWIAFVDDDDLWAPDKLAEEMAAGDESGAGWVYAGFVIVDDELCVRAGEPPASPRDVVSDLRRYNALPGGVSSVIIRRSVLERVGVFDPALRTSEDWDLWLRLASTGLPASVSQPLVALRTHRAMASRAVDQMLADVDLVAERHGIAVDRVRHERWAAWICLEDGRRREALRHYARAVALGDLVSIGRAVVALAFPAVAGRDRRSATTAWTQQAEEWLEPLRSDAQRIRGMDPATA